MAVMAAHAKDKGLDFTSHVAPDLPAVLVGDPHRLYQVLLNLISNAIKFTGAGSVAVEARLEVLSGDAARLMFAVRDTGTGISPQAQRKLFTAYTQGSIEVARKYGGTGLGLAICRRLGGMMGGEIALESSVGKGSTFSFTATFAIDRTTDPASIEKSAEATTGDSARARAVSRPLRVLQVEDNATNRRVGEIILTRAGHTVASVNNGVEALEVLARETFDILLMDRHMPEMDGLEATRRIRAAGQPLASVPIVGVTAGAIEAELTICLEAGMNDCLTKPLHAAKLQATLDRLAGDPHPDSAAAAPAPIDHGALSDILGTDDEAEHRALLDLFVDDFPALLGSIETALAAADGAKLHNAAHAAKGAAANIAAGPLSRLLGEIEADAAAGDWGTIRAKLDAVGGAYARLRAHHRAR